MAKYRFIGVDTRIGTQEFNTLGHSVDFDPETAKTVLLGGGKFLPEADFNDIFTSEEVAAFPYLGGFPEPPPEMLEKRKRAFALCDSHVAVHEQGLV